MTQITDTNIIVNATADKKAIEAVAKAFEEHSRALAVLAEALKHTGKSVGIEINNE